MLEKMGHIKNPLTVIAMFAAIAEVSGAIVLPFISSENQATYIWFLMFFPVVLVLIFFATLNFNHKALYAPSDWKDESNFFRMFSRATPDERQLKLNEEVAEAETAVDSPTQITPPLSSLPPHTETSRQPSISELPIDVAQSNRARIVRYQTAEKSAISKLSSDLHLSFRPDIAFHTSKTRKVIFDAVAIEQDRVNAVEVKLIFGEMFSRTHSDRILLETERVAKSVRETGKDFVLHYVAVLDSPKIDKAKIESRLRHYLNDYDYNIKLHIFSMEELQDIAA